MPSVVLCTKSSLRGASILRFRICDSPAEADAWCGKPVRITRCHTERIWLAAHPRDVAPGQQWTLAWLADADADAVTDDSAWVRENTAQPSEGTVTLLRGAPCRPTAVRVDPLARRTCWIRNSALKVDADSAAVGPLVESQSTCGLWGHPPCSDAAHRGLQLALLWALTVATLAMPLP
jgi:hypothetical protein